MKFQKFLVFSFDNCAGNEGVEADAASDQGKKKTVVCTKHLLGYVYT